MKKKIFTLLLALVAATGFSWAQTTVTWNSSTLSSINIRNGESFTKDGVTVTVLNGQIDGTSKWKGNSVEASFKFSTSLGNFTKIEITGEIRGLGGSGWTQASPGAVWTGDANEITFGMYFRDVTQIVFTIEEPAPATPKAYSSGTVALKDLIVGDTLMAGVTLTDDAGKAVFFVENRSAMNGSTMSNGGLFNQFTSMLTSPLLGDNASFSLLGGMTVTPINEEGNAGYAWVVVEGYPEPAAVYLAGIGTQSGSSDEGAVGALNGKFSVAGDKVVYFSKGNLQYNSGTQAWQFAENQYDYVGSAAGNTSITEDGIADNNGIVDLFGWVGASSTWTGLKQYGITTLDFDGLEEADGYGTSASEALKSDWGTTMGDGWFTLSTEQWTYLFNTRTGDKAATVNSVADCRYTKATINTDGTAVKGIILFPDGGTFAESEFTAVGSPNAANVDFTTTCTTAQWTALQAKGCVFLPVAGGREGSQVGSAGSRGYYWSSSAYDMSNAYFMYFASGGVSPADFYYRSSGSSVRLVTETAPAPTPTAIDQVTSDQVQTNQLQSTKVLRDGQLFILRGDKTYTIQGQEVK